MNRPSHAPLDADLPETEPMEDLHDSEPPPHTEASEEDREPARSFATLRNSLQAFRQ